jgi:DNA-binding NarL/FixJ family response regulator
MNFGRIKNVFLVDDDNMSRTMLNDYITANTHHKTTQFATGEDCLEHLATNPDVVVLDFELNTIVRDAKNGLQILEIIKKHYPNIHVIMLSSQERYGLAMQTLAKGAEQYVIKGEEAFEKVTQMINDIK